MRVIGPGVVAERIDKRFARSAMPSGVTVVVTKHGESPAKIKVTKGDKTWEIEEGQWDKLPEDLRPHVRRMVAGDGRRVGIGRTPPSPGIRLPKEIKDLDVRIEELFPQKLLPGAGHSEALNRQMKEMNKRLEEMQKDIDRLLKKRGRSSN